MTAKIASVVDDLFFLAKIRETAKAVGVELVTLDRRKGPSVAAEAHPSLVLVDLNARTLPALECIRALKADPSTQAIPILGFVSHVQDDLIAQARAAGCDKVMARSAFTRQLPELLRNAGNEGDHEG